MVSRYLPVPDGVAGMRLDAALARMLGLSRSAAADLIDSGGVTAGGVVLAKSTKLDPSMFLEVSMPEPKLERQPQVIPGMGILYDDDDLVIVDKPAGVAAHPSLGWDGPDVASGLAAAGYRISTSGAPERQGIVSRLDVGTSGAMVVAKSERAYSALKQMFKNREVKKVYHAVTQGVPEPLQGTIEAPIGRHPGSDWKFAVTTSGRHAVTHYEVIEMLRPSGSGRQSLGSAALAEIHLETGRTHQIRVHFAALKHPLVGDITYGADPKAASKLGLERQWLHARGLGFQHPVTGDWLEVTSEYPDDLANALEELRKF